jgi:hypothetical protein
MQSYDEQDAKQYCNSIIRAISKSLSGTISLQYGERDTCFRYSDNPEKLKAILEDTEILIRSVGTGPHFCEDNKNMTHRQRLQITIKRDQKEISFFFGMSIAATELLHKEPELISVRERQRKKQALASDLLYDLLVSINFDYYSPNSFSEFCTEYGYNEDSVEGRHTFFECSEQSTKLKRIFTRQEISCFPS